MLTWPDLKHNTWSVLNWLSHWHNLRCTSRGFFVWYGGQIVKWLGKLLLEDTFHRYKGTNKELHIGEMKSIFTLSGCICTGQESGQDTFFGLAGQFNRHHSCPYSYTAFVHKAKPSCLHRIQGTAPGQCSPPSCAHCFTGMAREGGCCQLNRAPRYLLGGTHSPADTFPMELTKRITPRFWDPVITKDRFAQTVGLVQD